MQRTGLEWLWRIKEEPQLFRRYFNDGLGFVRLMARQVLPLAVLQRVGAPPESEFARASLSHPQGTDAGFTRLAGAWRQDNLKPVRREFERLLARGADATLDMADVSGMDSAFIGLVLLLDQALTERGAQLRLINLDARLRRLLRLHGVHHLALQ
jgi:N-acetylglucosaminyldiphosphoundecaprenol N-acetyl-beta-D-mannosaminyltransferase